VLLGVAAQAVIIPKSNGRQQLHSPCGESMSILKVVLISLLYFLFCGFFNCVICVFALRQIKQVAIVVVLSSFKRGGCIKIVSLWCFCK
jgi:hypothetical protein